MTQYQEDEDPDSKIPTFAVAKKQRKELIAQLREGDAGDRRSASLIAQCGKGNRCNLIDCPVCELRRERAGRRASAPKTLVGGVVHHLYVKYVEVDGKRRSLNEAKVKFIAASMREIGQQSPITLCTVGTRSVLVDGLHRLAAAKLLRWDRIRCLFMAGDKIDARLWQISANLHRADLTVLERAESIEEWRMLIRKKAKVGQVAPLGGHQPKDVGINRTAKELSLTKEEVRRSKAIAGISPKAKAAAITGKLDNSQRALLEIAKQPTPSAQLKVIEEIIERRRAERARHASAAEQQAASEIAAIKAGLAKDKRTRESAKANIAYKRQRLQELKHAPAAGYGDMGITITNPSTAPSQDQDESATDLPLDVEMLQTQLAASAAEMDKVKAELAEKTERLAKTEEERAAVRLAVTHTEIATSPSTAPGQPDGSDNLDISPFLDRRDPEKAFAALKAAWDNAPPVARSRFVAEVLGIAGDWYGRPQGQQN
jgi:hypothetical protein